jgi:ribosomal protein L17
MTTNRAAKSAFRHAIRLGTGRAYLLAQAHPEIDFSTYIIEAALRCFAYDGQAEPNRAPYLYELYCLVPQQARIRRAVLRGLATERADTWALTQLFKLTLFFAQEGDAAARKALYRNFLRNPIRGSDWAGTDEIITLDGLAGLHYIARKYGQYLARHPDDWQDDGPIEFLREQCPDLDVWTALRQWAETDTDVRRYLQNVKNTLASQAYYQAAQPEPEPAPAPTLELLLRRPPGTYVRLAMRRQLPGPAETQQLAERLLTEQNPAVLENLLYLFSRVKFPLGYAPILALARQKTSRRYRLMEFATDALAHLSAPEVREFALEKLARTTRPGQYTRILRSNYQAGDAALLTSIAERFHNEHTIESLAVSYVAIYEANPTPECAGPLLALYAKMNCGMHRYEVVQLLLANGVLPAWLNEELPFDSYHKTRLLHQPPA